MLKHIHSDIYVVSGYVKAVPNQNYSSDTEDDDDDDGVDDIWPNFAEMTAVEDGVNYIRFTKQKEQTVTVSSVDGEQQYLLVARLVFIDPWWLITSKCLKKRVTLYGRGFPTYDLRRDSLACKHRLVHQFLINATRVNGSNEPVIDMLLNDIKTRGDDDNLTFDTLEENIRKFCYDDEEKEKYINSLIWKSCKGRIVRFAMMFPELFKMAATLLPFHLFKLVTSDYNDETFTELNQAVVDSPWIFGFRQILFKKYKITGMEADLLMYKNSGIMENIPPSQQDALYIYKALKLDARQKGHTYFPLNKLKYAKRYFNTYVVRNWKSALEFLQENHVVHIEVKGKQQNIFLYSNWKAENDVAFGLEHLLVRGTEDPLKWKVDFSSPDFDDIRNDKDQWLAAHLICNCPLAVFSGKGGCGKTTVVTKTLEHICKQRKPPENSILCEQFLSKYDISNVKHEGNHVGTQTTPISDDDSDFHSLSDTGSQILLTAPTGRAANLLGHKAGLKSYTLHSIITSYKNYCREQIKWKNMGEKQSAWSHSKTTVLVVDECSLVSVTIFATILNILLSQCELRKIILLGDVRQLPSIEPGNFLTDIFYLAQHLQFGVELTTNHRAESKLIVENATRISNQQIPEFDALQRFHLVTPDSEDDCYRDVMVRKLLNESPDVKDHVTSQFVSFRRHDCEAINEICCKYYNNHTLKNHKNKYDFRLGDKVCMNRNRSIKNHLNRLLDIKNKKEEHAKSDNSFLAKSQSCRSSILINMSVCKENKFSNKNEIPCKEHGYSDKFSNKDSGLEGKNKMVVLEDNSKTNSVETHNKMCQTNIKCDSEVKINNGDVFFITDDMEECIKGKMTRFLTLSDKYKEQENILCATYNDLRRECKMRHAWAKTIHTYQGSESDTVVYMLGTCGYQTWKHVYTAVTRGRKSVYIVGTLDCLNAAVKHQDDERRTSLQEKLKNVLSQHEKSVMICQKRIWASQESIETAVQNGENAVDEEHLFDSDDSWIEEVDVTTYGLEVDEFEEVFPSQQKDQHNVSFFMENRRDVVATGSLNTSHNETSGEIEADFMKRQASSGNVTETSPPKITKLNSSLSPAINYFKDLELDENLS